MAYKILSAVETAAGYVVKVHLDETKLTRWDEPDPDYIREWTWGIMPHYRAIHDSDGNLIPEEQRELVEEAEYMEAIKEMIAENVRNELALLPEDELAPRSGKPVAALMGGID